MKAAGLQRVQWCNSRPESKHGYRFRDGKGCTSSESEVRLRLHFGSKAHNAASAETTEHP